MAGDIYLTVVYFAWQLLYTFRRRVITLFRLKYRKNVRRREWATKLQRFQSRKKGVNWKKCRKEYRIIIFLGRLRPVFDSRSQWNVSCLNRKKKFFFSSFLYEQFSDFSRDYINSRNEMIRERSFRRDSKCRQIATPFTISFFIVLERFYRSSNSRLDLR